MFIIVFMFYWVKGWNSQFRRCSSTNHLQSMKSTCIVLSVLLLILLQSIELKGHGSPEKLDIWHECIHDEVQCQFYYKNTHCNNYLSVNIVLLLALLLSLGSYSKVSTSLQSGRRKTCH